MKIGYARISTNTQNLDLQIDALKNAGCEKIITDQMSGTKKERPGLENLFEYARAGDTVIVWRLDRLGRSLRDLLALMHRLSDNGIHFQSLQESINTSTTTGQLIFHIFASLSEFERNLTVERTKAGLEAARARGRMGGRPKKLNDTKIAMAISLYNNKEHTVKQICGMVGISGPTFYKYLKEKN